MKKILILIVAMLLIAGVAYGASIKNSKHDLSTGSTSGGYKAAGTSEICVFCHTPHGGGTLVPLWNHSTTAVSSFELYTNPSTLNATDLGQPGGASLACMSCHDGTVALTSLTNQPSPAATAGADAGGVVNDFIATGNGYLATDLSNDHPVSFTYDNTLYNEDGGLIDPSNASVAALLFSSKVECASCHDVHDPANVPFLVMSNSGSALCLTCHNK